MTSPLLLMIGGPAGCGKSTLARALAPEIGAALCDLDTATAPLTELVAARLGISDYDDPGFAAVTRTSRYRTVLDLCAENISLGQSVIAAAPFTQEARGEGLWGDFVSAASALEFVWLRIDPTLNLERLRERGAARDTSKIRRGPGGDDAPEIPTATMTVDAGLPLTEKVGLVLAHLAHRP